MKVYKYQIFCMNIFYTVKENIYHNIMVHCNLKVYRLRGSFEHCIEIWLHDSVHFKLMILRDGLHFNLMVCKNIHRQELCLHRAI